MDEMSGRFLLVTLELDLARCGTVHNVVMLGLQHVPGVHDVVDLGAIGPETLLDFLAVDRDMRALLEQRAASTSPDHLIRAWKRGQRQPKLL